MPRLKDATYSHHFSPIKKSPWFNIIFAQGTFIERYWPWCQISPNRGVFHRWSCWFVTSPASCCSHQFFIPPLFFFLYSPLSLHPYFREFLSFFFFEWPVQKRKMWQSSLARDERPVKLPAPFSALRRTAGRSSSANVITKWFQMNTRPTTQRNKNEQRKQNDWNERVSR